MLGRPPILLEKSERYAPDRLPAESSPKGTLPDYEGLYRFAGHPGSRGTHSVFPLGRDDELAAGEALLSKNHGLTVRGLRGSGQTTFSTGLAVQMARASGAQLFVFSALDVPIEGRSTGRAFARHINGMLDERARSLGTTRDALRGAGSVFLVDDLISTELYPERDQFLHEVRQLAGRENTHVVANLQEAPTADEIERKLGFETYPLPAMTPQGIWAMFITYAELFGVAFDPSDIAWLIHHATTPLEITKVVRESAGAAVMERRLSGTIGSALISAAINRADFEFGDNYLMLDRDLLSALVLESPYTPRNPEEQRTLARWSQYDLVRAVLAPPHEDVPTLVGDGPMFIREGPAGAQGYALTLNFFTQALDQEASAEMRFAARRIPDPQTARRVLTELITRQLSSRAGPVF